MALPGISYVYDPLGRLVAVTGPAGDTAHKNSDGVGTCSHQTSQFGRVVGHSVYAANRISCGSVVVHGTGFSLLSGGNSVTFNGVSATVISATATQIVMAVPPGATTGLISVTTATASAASDLAFTVVQLQKPRSSPGSARP